MSINTTRWMEVIGQAPDRVVTVDIPPLIPGGWALTPSHDRGQFATVPLFYELTLC